ncbi:hypothetical protein ANCDUO_13228 [Ancylostoma duodenale]|uniref:Unspecific monooxygenase n=1 Tax=Ancylostoma duodenale TaxID=51022 RepID=A0A0C2GHP2_9BILA|nr:hypothetical protein ANCDUO_13228 [Ancylostoma duodenale]
MQGGLPTVVTSDVEVIRDVSLKYFGNFHGKMPVPIDPDPVSAETVHMFASRGARWKRMRMITSQAMSAKNMKQLFPVVEESVFSFMNFVEKLPHHKKVEAHKCLTILRCTPIYASFKRRNKRRQHYKLDSSKLDNINVSVDLPALNPN